MDFSRNNSIELGFEPLDVLDTNDPLFHVCWRRQSCSHCLAGDVGCSWCATSSTCVPNPARLPILAPIRNDRICPLGSKERWELRALPFGCNVSTLTFLSVLGTTFGMLAMTGIGFVGYWMVRSLRRRWKSSDYERLDVDQPQSSRWGFLEVGLFASLIGAVVGRGDDRGRESSSSLREGDGEEDRHEDGETRPLLDGM